MDYKKPVNVLNIDDDNINNFILEKLVRKIAGNAKITMCLNGGSAIEYLLNVVKEDDDYPDFIFVDVAMPIMNGWEFLNEYKHYDLDKIIKSKVFVATSSVFKRDYDHAFTYDIVEDFITKPFSLDSLQPILNGRPRLV